MALWLVRSMFVSSTRVAWFVRYAQIGSIQFFPFPTRAAAGAVSPSIDFPRNSLSIASSLDGSSVGSGPYFEIAIEVFSSTSTRTSPGRCCREAAQLAKELASILYFHGMYWTSSLQIFTLTIDMPINIRPYSCLLLDILQMFVGQLLLNPLSQVAFGFPRIWQFRN